MTLLAAIALVLGSVFVTLLIVRLADLTRRVELLEASNRKRMPQDAMNEVLDAEAALVLLQSNLELKRAELDNAMAHLAKALGTGTKHVIK